MREYHDIGLQYPTQMLKFQHDCLTCNLHPTQKSITLLEYLIRTHTNEGDAVLDNCMGSGSAGVVCLNTNRDFIGMELDEHWFEIAEKTNRRTRENDEVKKQMCKRKSFDRENIFAIPNSQALIVDEMAVSILSQKNIAVLDALYKIRKVEEKKENFEKVAELDWQIAKIQCKNRINTNKTQEIIP